MGSKTVYAARRNSDMIEGRGYPVIVALFEKESDAVEVAKGREFAVMGVLLGHKPDVVPIRLYESAEEYKQEFQDAARKRALAKLTEDERRILGV